jgi:hypothetical protein
VHSSSLGLVHDVNFPFAAFVDAALQSIVYSTDTGKAAWWSELLAEPIEFFEGVTTTLSI